MAKRHFMDLLRARWAQGKFVCVGLDSELRRIMYSQWNVTERMAAFNEGIVRATSDLVCAYKPNIAFYEAQGAAGLEALRQTIRFIREYDHEIPVILDAKRGDIGKTNLGYVAAAFEELEADAITVSPYLGEEALQPFLDREEKGIIVLCKTSNPGSSEFQNLPVRPNGVEISDMIERRLPMSFDDPKAIVPCVPFYEYVAYAVATRWNTHGNCAVVVGATYPKELEVVRGIVGDMPILIPGIGTQGGDVQATVRAARRNMIINSSSGIIFSKDPRAATQQLDSQIRHALAEVS